MKDKTVLYIDDELINLNLFKYSFRNYFNILLAQSADEAMGLLKKNHVDLLLTDQKMPNKTGLDLCRELEREKSSVPRIVVTGYVDDKQIQEANESNLVDDVVFKPYNAKELLKIIQTYL